MFSVTVTEKGPLSHRDNGAPSAGWCRMLAEAEAHRQFEGARLRKNHTRTTVGPPLLSAMLTAKWIRRLVTPTGEVCKAILIIIVGRCRIHVRQNA